MNDTVIDLSKPSKTLIERRQKVLKESFDFMKDYNAFIKSKKDAAVDSKYTKHERISDIEKEPNI